MADDAPKDIQSLLSKLKEGVVPTEDLIRVSGRAQRRSAVRWADAHH